MNDGRCSCGARTESSSGLCGACIQRGTTIYSSSVVANVPAERPSPALTARLRELVEKWRTEASDAWLGARVQRACADELDALLVTEGQPQWRPIRTAPKDGERVRLKRVYRGALIAEGVGYFGSVTINYQVEDGGPKTLSDVWIHADGRHLFPTPTHWARAEGQPKQEHEEED